MLLLFFATGLVHAGALVAVDDIFEVPNIPAGEPPFYVEPNGVLNNDTIDLGDGELVSAGENGAKSIIVSEVSNGELSCPDNLELSLCPDGSFEYKPGTNFTGTDSFTYQAVSSAGVSQATVMLTACVDVALSGAPVFSCWKEASYLAKLSEFNYYLFQEGFESAVWDSVRSPDLGTAITAPSITSKGIIWTTNHSQNKISTVSGAARTSSWGGFDPLHGLAEAEAAGDTSHCDFNNPTPDCLPHDGLSGSGTNLHGIGGYFSGSQGANIAIMIDGVEIDTGRLIDTGYHFTGVIDTSAAGFTDFEFRELDGKIGQELFIFGDDFIIATSDPLFGNTQPVADAGAAQSVFVGDNVPLDGSGSSDVDDDIVTYNWTFISQPMNSTTMLFDSTLVNPSFLADKAGTYVVQLIVNDGLVDSVASTVTINSVQVPITSILFILL